MLDYQEVQYYKLTEFRSWEVACGVVPELEQ